MKRIRLVAIQVLCLFVVVSTVLVGYKNLFAGSWERWRPALAHPTSPSGMEQRAKNTQFALLTPKPFDSNCAQVGNEAPKEAPATSPTNPPPPSTHSSQKPGDPKLYESASGYVASILDSQHTVIPRLECPTLHVTRYEYLQTSNDSTRPRNLKYFFALDLRQSLKVLPRLLGSIVEAVRFLGPASCALSIVEGNSDDGTFEVLDLLQPELEKLGLKYIFRHTDVDSKEGERITKLAALRNMALEPLHSKSLHADKDTTVVFLNDVAACSEDILELVHQRVLQSADMTCAMDWVYVGNDPTFYDVWVARTLKGNTFFDIPPDGNWNSAWNLFWNDSESKRRYQEMLPFQVYACWNGAAVFGAAPVLGLPPPNKEASHTVDSRRISFRSARQGECHVGEPTLFCKDMWWAGFGKIAVVPTVNLEYSDEAAKKIKDLKGYTSKWTESESKDSLRIEWASEPPENVKCMPGWENQSWRPWNETLEE
ncbi:hypothetical protein JX266_007611 [Neoarthrinium moseri]|nr:hypothetical protein JX266_007611 [Neoarthrinium moseri]